MKFAVRAMAQSLAREYGPKGVHVGHAVMDGVIDIERTKAYDMGQDGKISPQAVSLFPLSKFNKECFPKGNEDCIE